MSRILIGNVRDKLVNNLLATKAGTGALDAAQGKVLKDLVESVLGQQADTYSKKTYAVGDYCIYGNALYKCNTAISSAEEWTAGHWTKTTIANELKSIVGSVATVNNAITELNGKIGGSILHGTLEMPVGGTANLTFEKEFATKPCIVFCPSDSTASVLVTCTSISSKGVTVKSKNLDSGYPYSTIYVSWIALG